MLVSALVAVVAPADAEVSDAVVLLEPKLGAEVDTNGCFDAIEAHAAGSGLGFARTQVKARSPLAEALERSRQQPLLAVFWLEAAEEQVQVYLYDPRNHAVYVRAVDRRGGTDAALVEAVGLIAASTAMALRSGETVAMRKISEQEWAALQAPAEPEEPDTAVEPEPPEPSEPENSEPPEEPEVEPETPARKTGLDFGAGYRGASFNGTAPWQHGAAGRLGVAVGRGLLLEVGYGWSAAADIASSPAIALVRHEPELAAGWRWRFGSRFAVDALGLAGVELGRWRSDGRGALRTRGRLGAAVRPAVGVGAGVFIEVRLAAKAALNGFDFVVCDSPEQACTGDARQVVASGWRVAPEVTVGVTYRLGVTRKK